MTIVELGSIGEFFASIAVLITLIVLVLQMRQNTKVLLRTNVRQSAEHNDRALAELLDEGVAEIFLRGQRSLANLNDLERYRFDIVFTMWLKSVEQAFIDYQEGTFTATAYIAYENSISGFLTTPGGAEWWQERQVWFSHPFREEVARLCAQPPAEASTAGPPNPDR